MRKYINFKSNKRICDEKFIIRKPCLCCECLYWSTAIDNLGLIRGNCSLNKPAFPEMSKCEDFKVGNC